MSPSAILRFLFSPFGRLARLPFLGVLAWSLTVSLAMAIVQKITADPFEDPLVLTPRSTLFLVAAIALILWPLVAGVARRLHDLNVSGWWVLPVFATPLIGLIQEGALNLPQYDAGWTDGFARAYQYAALISPIYFGTMILLLCVIPSRPSKQTLP